MSYTWGYPLDSGTLHCCVLSPVRRETEDDMEGVTHLNLILLPLP
jgi:hypothetical protein